MSSESAARSGQYLPLAACIALCSMGPLSGLAQSALPPILPQITAHFAGDPNAGVLVRLMVSGLSAAMIVGALVSGFLAEKVGELRLLLICLVIYGFAGAAGFVLEDLRMMVASRLLLGVVFSAASGLAMALITTEIAPHARDRWVGFFVVSGTVAAVLLVGIVGAIGKYDWRYVFLLYAAAWPCTLFLALTFPRRAATPRMKTAREAATGYGIPWRMMLVAMLVGAIGTTVFMYLPYHLAALGQGRPEQLAPVMMTSTALGAIGSTAYGWIRRHASSVAVFVGGPLLAAIGLLVVISTGERAVIFVGIALYGTGLGVVMPNVFSGCAAATPAIYRPRMLGFVRSTFYGGPLLAQVGLEMVLGRFGPPATLLAIALICAGVALLALLFRRTFEPIEDAAPAGSGHG
jgi:predicted MFS family arabinose efflux permease